MKAMVCRKYGGPDVLQYQEVDKPIPGDHEILVKILAAAINPSDIHIMRGDPIFLRLDYGLQKPKYTVLGNDVAGKVEAVGRNVTQFKVGDEVFGETSLHGYGAFAEYVCAAEQAWAHKPANMTFEEAAAVPEAAMTALQALRDKGHVQPGQKVLINGASGGVGTYAIQIAKALGAEVTAVCSPRNLDLARSLGADHVVDYSKEDFTKSGQHYDVILAANGNHPLSAYRRVLNPNGIYICTGGAMTQVFQALIIGPIISKFGSRSMGSMIERPSQKDLFDLKALIEAGKIKALIDRRYPLDNLAEAFHYLQEGHARGKIVITIGQ